jgi:hypothetical protein
MLLESELLPELAVPHSRADEEFALGVVDCALAAVDVINAVAITAQAAIWFDNRIMCGPFSDLRCNGALA